MMSEPDETWAIRLLRKLSASVYGHRRLWLYPQIVLFGLAVYYTITNLEFSTNRNDLVGSDKRYHHNFMRFKEEFPGQDDIAAVIESEDAEKNRQFVERLGAKLEKETNLFAEVFYKGDLKMLGPKALLFLDEQSLRELQKTLADYRPFLAQFQKATNLNSLFQLINNQFRTAKQEANAENESLIKAIPALQRIIDLGTDAIGRPGIAPSPGVTALFDAGPEAQEQQYITFAKGRFYLVNVRTGREEDNPRAVIRLRELVAETQVEVPGVNVGVTGEPVLELDEMEQSQHDSTIATIVSLVASALIFIYGYRETGRPIKAVICLVVGLGYTMGYTTFVVGHLNILTITFLPILIGLAIDFGVHLITRYEEELRHGRSEKVSLEKAMVNTGLGIFTGAFTTAGAFFAMGFTDFKGIKEMGIISGGGLLICLVPMMTMLPVLLLRGRQNKMDEVDAAIPKVDRRAQLEKMWLDRPFAVVLITFALCAACITQFPKVFFDYNLLHMQSAGLPAVEFEEKLIKSANKSVLFAAVIADNAQEALELEKRISKLPTVATNDTMSQFLTGDQGGRLAIIGQIKRDLQTIRFAPMDMEPVNVDALSLTLWSLHGYLGLAIGSVEEEKDVKLADQLRSMRKSIEEFRRKMNTADHKVASQRLAAYQQALFRDIQETFRALRNQDNSSPLRVEDLPASLRNRFIGKTGKHLIQVYPKEDVWEREPQEKFVKELRTVDPDVTGTPIQLLEYTTLLKNSYIEAAWYALGAIAILVFFHFRNLSSVVLALLPVLIGTIWMIGMMGWRHIPFNPANIMTLPLVIGIGVTNGIHILNRFAEEQNPGILAKSTGKAVLVSALTTIAGFGSLIPAKHQGIASLGSVMAVGVATCMIAGLTFLPAILTLLIRKGWTMKKPSGDNALSTLGREEPR
ncbi:MAG TPA: MMPL family transporter [Verrucomicrobiae bacterium]|nr:MMPL family transporter [Verrucomicrobiae bacterium]